MPAPVQARDPKAVMKIETLNATFQPAKIGNPCGLQITYLKDNSTRNIFVYHSDAKVRVHVCFYTSNSIITHAAMFAHQTQMVLQGDLNLIALFSRLDSISFDKISNNNELKCKALL